MGNTKDRSVSHFLTGSFPCYIHITISGREGQVCMDDISLMVRDANGVCLPTIQDAPICAEQNLSIPRPDSYLSGALANVIVVDARPVSVTYHSSQAGNSGDIETLRYRPSSLHTWLLWRRFRWRRGSHSPCQWVYGKLLEAFLTECLWGPLGEICAILQSEAL